MNDKQSLRSIVVPRSIPIVLSFVAGYVDSCTYLALFGVFVAQVTGSFVLAGTQIVRSEPGALAKLLAIPVFFLAGVASDGARPSAARSPARRLGFKLGGRKPVVDRLLGGVSSRHALPRSGCAGRDRRAAVRNGGDGRTKRAGAPADAGPGLDQRYDHEYDTARHQFGLKYCSVGSRAAKPARPRARMQGTRKRAASLRRCSHSGLASSRGPHSAPSPTSLWGCPAYCWRFCRSGFWRCGTRAARNLPTVEI